MSHSHSRKRWHSRQQSECWAFGGLLVLTTRGAEACEISAADTPLADGCICLLELRGTEGVSRT